MKVQIYSDIHLEYYSKIPLIESKSKILILAGDIGYLDSDIYNEFMNYVSKNWNYVFIVLGNHEYYHDTKTFTEINKQAKHYFSKFNNIVLLDSDIYLLEDILIIGCTLWSNIDERVKDYINDFNYIKMLDEKNNFVKLSIQEYQNLHQKNKDFLLSSFLDNYKKVIIITHYPLTQENTSHPKYNKDPKWIKNYFSNQIDLNNIDLNNNDKEIICISGHTHYSFDFIKNNIRYISNQFGYKNEIKNSKLKIDGVFELFS